MDETPQEKLTASTPAVAQILMRFARANDQDFNSDFMPVAAPA